MPDPTNPYARPSPWPTAPKSVSIGPSRTASPPPPKPAPPPSRNNIFSGSAVPMGPPPQPRAATPPPEPKPEPRPEPPHIAALPATPPPLRETTFVAPPPRPRRRARLRERLPLFASLAVGLAGLVALALVFTRQPAPEPLPEPHRPTVVAAPVLPPRFGPDEAPAQPQAAAAEAPTLRGRADARPVRTARRPEPKAVAPKADVLPDPLPPPVAVPPPPPIAAPPLPQPKAATPPPADPEAPIATRAPFAE